MAYVWRTAAEVYEAMGRQGILGEEVGADDEELGRHLSVITVLKKQSWVPQAMVMRWMKTYFTKFASNFFENSEETARMLAENGVVVSGALIRSFLLNDRKPVPGRRRNHARAHLDLFVGAEKYKETIKWLCSAENGWKRTRKEDNTGQTGVQARIRYLKGGYVGRVTRLVKVAKENKSRCWRMDVVGCGSFMTTQAALRFEECCGDKEHGCWPVMWVLMPPVERITDQSLELMGEIRENLIERVGGVRAMSGGNGKWMDVGAKRIGGGITWSTGAEAVDGVKPEEYRWLNGQVIFGGLRLARKFESLRTREIDSGLRVDVCSPGADGDETSRGTEFEDQRKGLQHEEQEKGMDGGTWMRTYEWREQMVVGESRGAVVSAPGADAGADSRAEIWEVGLGGIRGGAKGVVKGRARCRGWRTAKDGCKRARKKENKIGLREETVEEVGVRRNSRTNVITLSFGSEFGSKTETKDSFEKRELDSEEAVMDCCSGVRMNNTDSRDIVGTQHRTSQVIMVLVTAFMDPLQDPKARPSIVILTSDGPISPPQVRIEQTFLGYNGEDRPGLFGHFSASAAPRGAFGIGRFGAEFKNT
ncbi:hypothetical protein SISSUDRAFT_1038565 [Sistotremastrum suecicum HHB10207 ss-3]|uniref:Uncharacterized protein n=1 Tax=Sistotremastrum suecicum HHB10207 ss-3 TaxID=1314776 RepID=A0A165WKE0_9AGAM|nr:hypothetical protein SISSUDRAFT_1038565 [Sistotremastrum suecicum HHB10207 ss-3]